MSYLHIDNPELSKDILWRKEFYQLKDPNIPSLFEDDIIPRFALEQYIIEGRYLQLTNYQIFVRNFMNPNTPYNRLLLKWSTGSGKGIGAISLSMEFIKQYRNQTIFGEIEIGSVFILGFTDNIFKREFRRFPEFGFISQHEIQKLETLMHNATSHTKSDIEKLTEFQMIINKRFSNRKGNGFFRFYGYKQLINRLFILGESDIISDMKPHEVVIALATGIIRPNEELLDQFRNSLIICDEIHNTYNSMAINNWGLCIQFILDKFPNTRALFLSATPINNSPTEIVDLLNLLVPPKYREFAIDYSKTYRKQSDLTTLDEKSKKNTERISNLLIKSDLFGEGDQSKYLRKDASKKIAKMVQGRISFLRDVNPKDNPSRCILGDKIPGIEYLRFIRSPMTTFHYKTYKNIFTGTLSQEAQNLIDYALPNPDGWKNEELDQTMQTEGLFKTSDTKRKLLHAPKVWKEKYQIDYVDKRIVGNFASLPNLKLYSAKYANMMLNIRKMIKNKCGKIFIFHPMVYMSGVIFIQEVLLRNGIISENGVPVDDSLCVICGEEMQYHLNTTGANESDNANSEYNPDEKFSDWLVQGSKESKKTKKKPKDSRKRITDHIFKPAKFIIVHSDIDKSMILKRIETFNDSNNAEGQNILILLGSKVIRESYDIRAIQNTMIMGRPDNIAMLIQILGRAVRKFSHRDLPIDKRHVRIYLYTSCLPTYIKGSTKSIGNYNLSYEEIKYKLKIEDYKVIQTIEQIFHENAIDAVILRNIIAPNDKFQNTIIAPNGVKCSYELDVLPFKPTLIKTMGKKATKTYKLSELTLSTFDAYHNQKEINAIILVIKRLFIEISPVWDINTLWNTVQKYPSEVNSRLFDVSNFILGLQSLVGTKQDSQYVEPYIIPNFAVENEDYLKSKYHMKNMIDRIFDPQYKKIILPNGQEGVIQQYAKYYILFPIDICTGKAIVDIELPYRGFIKKSIKRILIKPYLERYKSELDYDDRKHKFYMKYRNVKLEHMGDAICECGGDFHIQLLEDSIECVFTSWVFPFKKQVPMHGFYFKMVYYYDAINAVIWASMAKEYIVDLYKKYIMPVKSVVSTKGSNITLLNLIQSNIDKITCIDCTKETQDKCKKMYTLNVKNYATHSSSKDDNLIVPASADKLPIGHFFKYIPRFYHPIRGWFSAPEYIEAVEWKENDIIIGYDEKSKTSLTIRFKIRSPAHKIKKFKDIRMVEKGSVCKSKNKEYLINICQQLKIDIPPKNNVIILCDKIRTKLMELEIKERKTPKSTLKWYYLHFERQVAIEK